MEENIIKLFSNNDEQAISQIRLQYGNRIKYIVFGIVKNNSDAEECENDIYVRIWNNRNKFNSEKGSLYSWVSIIARNTALNYLKSNRPVFEELSENDCTVNSPEEETENKENLIKILNTVNQLPTDERNLFLRRYYYLQSISQIAAETGRSERATEGKLYRLRKKLQKKLGGDFDA